MLGILIPTAILGVLLALVNALHHGLILPGPLVGFSFTLGIWPVYAYILFMHGVAVAVILRYGAWIPAIPCP